VTVPTDLRGVFPVLQAPFDDDNHLDEVAIVSEIDWVFRCGANGVVLGMVSELLRLTDDERFGFAESVCKRAVAWADRRECWCGKYLRRGSSRRARCDDWRECHNGHAADSSRERDRSGVDAVLRRNTAGRRFAARCSGRERLRGTQSFYRFAGAPLRRVRRPVLFKPEGPPVGIAISSILERTEGKARIFEGLGGGALVESHRRGVIGSMPGQTFVGQ